MWAYNSMHFLTHRCIEISQHHHLPVASRQDAVEVPIELVLLLSAVLICGGIDYTNHKVANLCQKLCHHDSR